MNSNGPLPFIPKEPSRFFQGISGDVVYYSNGIGVERPHNQAVSGYADEFASHKGIGTESCTFDYGRGAFLVMLLSGASRKEENDRQYREYRWFAVECRYVHIR